MHDKQQWAGERLAGRTSAVAAVGFVLFIPPLLSTFGNGSTLLFGVPTLWVYLMAAWAVVIGLVAMVLRWTE